MSEAGRLKINVNGQPYVVTGLNSATSYKDLLCAIAKSTTSDTESIVGLSNKDASIYGSQRSINSYVHRTGSLKRRRSVRSQTKKLDLKLHPIPSPIHEDTDEMCKPQKDPNSNSFFGFFAKFFKRGTNSNETEKSTYRYHDPSLLGTPAVRKRGKKKKECEGKSFVSEDRPHFGSVMDISKKPKQSGSGDQGLKRFSSFVSLIDFNSNKTEFKKSKKKSKSKQNLAADLLDENSASGREIKPGLKSTSKHDDKDNRRKKKVKDRRFRSADDSDVESLKRARKGSERKKRSLDDSDIDGLSKTKKGLDYDKATPRRPDHNKKRSINNYDMKGDSQYWNAPEKSKAIRKGAGNYMHRKSTSKKRKSFDDSNIGVDGDKTISFTKLAHVSGSLKAYEDSDVETYRSLASLVDKQARKIKLQLKDISQKKWVEKLREKSPTYFIDQVKQDCSNSQSIVNQQKSSMKEIQNVQNFDCSESRNCESSIPDCNNNSFTPYKDAEYDYDNDSGVPSVEYESSVEGLSRDHSFNGRTETVMSSNSKKYFDATCTCQDIKSNAVRSNRTSSENDNDSGIPSFECNSSQETLTNDNNGIKGLETTNNESLLHKYTETTFPFPNGCSSKHNNDKPENEESSSTEQQQFSVLSNKDIHNTSCKIEMDMEQNQSKPTDTETKYLLSLKSYAECCENILNVTDDLLNKELLIVQLTTQLDGLEFEDKLQHEQFLEEEEISITNELLDFQEYFRATCLLTAYQRKEITTNAMKIEKMENEIRKKRFRLIPLEKLALRARFSTTPRVLLQEGKRTGKKQCRVLKEGNNDDYNDDDEDDERTFI